MQRRCHILFIICLFSYNISAVAQLRFSDALCTLENYQCITIEPGESWESLFPDPAEADIVRRINRMNITLRPGMKIAVPRNMEQLDIYDVSPFPRYIESTGEKTIYVNQTMLAWGAYNEQGELVWWGPISPGSGRCNRADGHCETPSGAFRIIRKQDIDCVSTAFPVNEDGVGGAEMPYCMHFFRGFALHGSDVVPGYRASHGCVRLFVEDARWLNEEFIDLPGGSMKGTRVIIEAPE